MASASYPEAVEITDITPRDGFQNVKEWIPTEVKKQIIDELVAAGLRRFEVTSFISPKAIPQMKDSGDVARYAISRHPEVAFAALVPNLRGAHDAVAAGIREISYVVSVTPAHNQANINRSHEQSFSDLAGIVAAYPDLAVNLSLATVFGCPFEGKVTVDQVLALLRKGRDLGVVSASLCDTIGVANPLQIVSVVEAVKEAHPDLPLALHLHDTHGMGLANSLAAMQAGVTRFETAAGGLGGCPFAPGASGNTATEDFANMLRRMGIATGVDLPKLLVAVQTVKSRIEPNIPSRMAVARNYFEFDF